MTRASVPEAAFLIASLLFIFGLKRLSSPRTARSGNTLAAIGMALALGGTFLLPGMGHFGWILLAIVIGALPGWLLARRVKMTAMPQMVSLFNGMGGACALFISLGEWLGKPSGGRELGRAFPMLLGVVFGSVSFTGSLVAFGKLQGLITEKPLRWPLQKTGNALLLAVILASSAAAPSSQNEIWILLPAAAVTGFAMHNMSMIIAGTLVGAAGSFLTVLMCKAMNRSLAKVIFGSFGLAPKEASAAAQGDQSMREIAASECAVMMGYARKVIIIPGYGLAVAQGQHLVHDLDEALEKRGVEVKYAIHPVAGRMPGHMNVLLAEADVPYPKLLDMEEINPEFDQADVALIIGANDVVNPAARTDAASPIYGMPILNADKAKNVIVIKRGRGAGFAGIENGLFYNPKTRMLFGDAKKALQELVTEVKAL